MKKGLLCIGNPLRGDDGIGIEVGRLVEEKLDDWEVFFGYDVPENVFGDIRKFKPEILVVVDAMSGFKDNGVYFLDLSKEIDYVYSTHNLPMPVLLMYLRKICTQTFFLGLNVMIENMLDIKEELSPNAKKSALKAVEMIKNLESNLKE